MTFEQICWSIAVANIIFSIISIVYMRGYTNGYKAGLDCGMKGLEEYHELVINTLRGKDDN
jgi:hypothetical protein